MAVIPYIGLKDLIWSMEQLAGSWGDGLEGYKDLQSKDI